MFRTISCRILLQGYCPWRKSQAGLRYIPDYSDNYGNLQDGSGFEQSAIAIMGDIGAQTRFNLVKLYNSRSRTFSRNDYQKPWPSGDG